MPEIVHYSEGRLITDGGQNIPDSALTQSGTSATVLPTVGSITYNADGTVATDADGVAYTYNADGTVATMTKGGTTRTYSYNADGTVGSVA